MKFFNIAGPIRPKFNYYVPNRFNDEIVRELIDQGQYFVLHAPRQSGKTTSIRMFVDELNREGTYKALYINVEPAQVTRGDVSFGIQGIVRILRKAIREHIEENKDILSYIDQCVKDESPIILLQEVLSYLSLHTAQPIVLFIDEIDSLVGDTLISVLRQLRAGYIDRPESFPQGVCLVGVRDVRDYRIWSEVEQHSILGGSAFNIKSDSLVLANFTLQEVRGLYLQHTEETGQKFTDDAIEYAFYLTKGQPWLVNALAYRACFSLVKNRSKEITKDIIDQCKDILILRRDTHIDVLIDRLQEPRVRNIIDTIIAGNSEFENFPVDDVSYVIDLGLVTNVNKRLEILNPIYKEIIPRELSSITQFNIEQDVLWYQNSDKSIKMEKLLQDFTDFYRKNSAVWFEQFSYKESGPHLLLMAFLQRIINGGGRIQREYALGRTRVDLLIEWPHGKQRIVIELKIWHGPKTIEEGLLQTLGYMDSSNATEGHLIIFDRSEKPWDEKIFQREELVQGKTVTIWGM